MNDLAAAKTRFLDQVERYAPGQATRFRPALDDLIRWSEEHGLLFTPKNGSQHVVTFGIPDIEKSFWSARPRSADGAKLNLLGNPNSRLPDVLFEEAREELSRINGQRSIPGAIPELAFIKLVWEPYRVRVLELMTRLLKGVQESGGLNDRLVATVS